MTSAVEAFYLPADGGRRGQRFCLFRRPRAPARGAVVHVHPFADEMNKSRRMAALQSRALAAAGFAVLQIDLFGCGDSSGDFGDASWDDWVADVAHAARHLQRRCEAPLWLWGVRAGALVAVDAARRIDGPCNFLFWQPAPAGRSLLQQFLRIAGAREMLGGSSAGGATDALQRRLAAGETVEVGGYRLAPALADGLADARLTPPAGAPVRVAWLEVSTRPTGALAPAAAEAAGRWAAAGHEIDSRVMAGPSFWQTTEIEDAPNLLTATLEAVEEKVAA